MYKIKKCPMVILTIAAGILTSALNAGKVHASTLSDTERIWGVDRYETAAKISKEGWGLSKYAIIASGEGYADALCAAPLAKIKDAPILLTNKDELNRYTLNELKRLEVKSVYIIGGKASVSREVEDKIKNLTGAEVERLEGSDRYETSVKVAQKLGETDKAIVVSGEGYADALSSAPVAAIKGMPILLTKANELPIDTRKYISNLEINNTYVIGGAASVSDNVKNSVPNGKRIYGQDRFQTNAEVIKEFALDFEFKNAYVALASGETGKEFADALAGSALAGKKEAPVILTGKNLSSATKELAQEMFLPTTKITALGGYKNVSDGVMNSVKINVAKCFDSKDTDYNKDINGNALINAESVTLKDMKIKGNLYIEDTHAELNNVIVDGKIYINVGREGVCELKKVTAKDIVVLSADGSKDSVVLEDANIKNLNILSKSLVKIVTQKGTEISNTIISTSAALEQRGGSFGKIRVLDTPKYKEVELEGSFNDKIIVEGQVELKSPYSSRMATIELRTGKGKEVLLDGKFEDVEVYNAITINVTKGTKAAIKAIDPKARAGAKINLPYDSNIETEGIRRSNINERK